VPISTAKNLIDAITAIVSGMAPTGQAPANPLEIGGQGAVIFYKIYDEEKQKQNLEKELNELKFLKDLYPAESSSPYNNTQPKNE
jgi:hypothetical protein